MTATERLKEYERLYPGASPYDPVRFQQDFEKSYGEATNYNQDLISERADAIGQAQALPAELRAHYAKSAIRNPLEQEALIAQRRSGITSDITRLTDLLGQRQSRYQDVLGKHLQAYLGDMQRHESERENAWRMYQDALQREEAERARAQAAADAARWRDLFTNQPGPEVIEQGEDDFRIPTGTRGGGGLFERTPTPTNLVQDALASGVLRYQNAPNAFAKYGELMRGTALSALGGIPGMTSYTTALAPSVWKDIKGGATNLWNSLVRK